MKTEYKNISNRYARKAAGWFLLVIGLVAIAMFFADIQQEQQFTKEGIKTQATVTGLEFSFTRIGLSKGSGGYPVAFDYEYTVDGKSYVVHTPSFEAASLHKGDSVNIEYLASSPGISHFEGNIKDVAFIKILIGVSIGFVIMGIGILVWPGKKQNMKSEVDWSEYERTHE